MREGITRREFVKHATVAPTLFVLRRPDLEEGEVQVPVALAKSGERKTALRTVLELLGPPALEGKDVYLKANYSSADGFPATTHPETLRLMVQSLRETKCGRIFLAERSGMGSTKTIWSKLEIPALARELSLTLIALDELPPERWRRKDLPGSHWKQGIEVPEFLEGEPCVVQICNLKTHRFGGQFSGSLKNSIGLIAKHSHKGPPYNYMEELHGSPRQRLMIAEVNQVYQPSLLVMDAMQVFVDGGPEAGELAGPEVFLASQDRVALDAVGAALLRHHGARAALGRSLIFELDQIKRAVEIELGAKSGKEVKLLARGADSENLAALLRGILTEIPPEEKG